MPEKITSARAITIIVILGIVVFFNALFNGFVGDDKSYITQNPELSPANTINFFGKNFFNTAGQYRPITVIYFYALRAIAGNTAFIYHALQISLHITNAVLVLKILDSFLHRRLSLILSLVFLVHPLQVESVSYIAQTGGLILFFLGLTVLSQVKKPLRAINYISVSALLLISMLIKETGVIFVLLAVLYVFLFAKESSKKTAFVFCAFTNIIVYFFIRLFVGQIGFSTRPLTPIVHIPFTQRLTTIPSVIFYYLKTFIWPSKLIIDQQWVVEYPTISTFFLPLAIDVTFVVVMLLVGYYLYRFHKSQLRAFVFFSSWLILGLFFHSQIFPLDMTVADRWFYLPMVGLLGTMGIILQAFLKEKIESKYFIGSAIVILFLLSTRTVTRNTNWKDDLTLLQHDIQYENNFNMNNNLGIEYINIGEYQKALSHFLTSVRQQEYEYNLHNTGVAYEKLGNVEKAKEYYWKSLNATDYGLFQGHNHDEKSYKSLASTLVFYDDPQKAKEFIQNALQDYPQSSDLWFFLALAEAKLKNTQKALQAAQTAYSLSPNPQDTYVYSRLKSNQPFEIIVNDKTFKFSSY